MSDDGFALRFRVGIAAFDDGYNVIVRIGDDPPLVYDPTFKTEAEAEAKAAAVSAALRKSWREQGMRFE